jgi:hypothetical protein
MTCHAGLNDAHRDRDRALARRSTRSSPGARPRPCAPLPASWKLSGQRLAPAAPPLLLFIYLFICFYFYCLRLAPAAPPLPACLPSCLRAAAESYAGLLAHAPEVFVGTSSRLVPLVQVGRGSRHGMVTHARVVHARAHHDTVAAALLRVLMLLATPPFSHSLLPSLRRCARPWRSPLRRRWVGAPKPPKTDGWSSKLRSKLGSSSL